MCMRACISYSTTPLCVRKALPMATEASRPGYVLHSSKLLGSKAAQLKLGLRKLSAKS